MRPDRSHCTPFHLIIILNRFHCWFIADMNKKFTKTHDVVCMYSLTYCLWCVVACTRYRPRNLRELTAFASLSSAKTNRRQNKFCNRKKKGFHMVAHAVQQRRMSYIRTHTHAHTRESTIFPQSTWFIANAVGIQNTSTFAKIH